ncbi:MAG TPA: MFS transporter, partial [Nitrolancea sp.]|nr:MFS transporter [Nitrolancea sp.]
MGTAPLGSFVVGWVAEQYGVADAIMLMTGLCALGVVLGLLYLARHRTPAGSVKTREREAALHD